MNKRFSALQKLALALAVAVFLGAPGTARAAGSPGLADLSAEVDAALAEADAVAPGVSASVEPAVSQALAYAAAPAAAPAPAAAEPSGPASGDVTRQLEGLLASTSSAAASPGTTVVTVDPAAAEVTVESRETHAVRTTHPGARTHAVRKPARAARPAHPGLSIARPGSIVPAASPVAAGMVSGERAASVSSERQPRRAEPSPAGAAPRPLPPLPPAPRPDVSSPGQAGSGQSPLVPLVVAGLLAAFTLFGFQYLTRRLPRLAFRKPRRVALAVWHPG